MEDAFKRAELIDKAKRLHKQCGTWAIARMLAKHGIPVKEAARALATKPKEEGIKDFTLDFTK